MNIYNSRSKDIFKINKGFVFGLFDSNDGEGDSQNDNKYSFLADNQEIMNDIVDFTDPAALMRRQQRILESIEKQANRSNFDPLRILRKKQIKWMIILCHGGKFVLQAYTNLECTMSKSESKYVIRGK